MRVRVQQEQKFLVTTKRALWRYENAFIFTNQSEVDFGITLVLNLFNACYANAPAALIENILPVWREFTVVALNISTVPSRQEVVTRCKMPRINAG